MDTLFFGFEQILRQEIELYQKLLDLSAEKTDVIVKGDTDGLDRITKEEQALILQAGSLEREREQCIRDMGSKDPDLLSCMTLSDLIQFAPHSHKQTLASLGSELTKLLEEQKDRNSMNSSLIRNNLDYIENLLSKMQGNTPLYNMDGTKVKGGLDSGILDKKA